MGKIYKTLIYDNQISLSIIEATDICNKAIQFHNTTPLATATLGRTMIASLFMASTLKNKGDRLSVTVAGDGVGGRVIVSCDSDLKVRGYIENPNATLPLKENGKLDVAGCVGKGRITIVRNMGMKEPYTGSSQIVSGELAEDFSYYYALSEQQPTAMALGVKVQNDICIGAGGIVIQTMPFCSEKAITDAENLIANFQDISEKIRTLGAKGIIEKYFSEYSFNEYDANYECICSNDYITSMLIAIGKQELLNILDEVGKIEIKCEYCDKVYLFDKTDVDKLFGE